ncbi:MAG: serine/threonine protein kinase [Lachnospiraceae bacterium]
MGLIWKERYEEKRQIGRGGSGIVYLAWDKIGQCEVAVKEYEREMTARQESYILRKLSCEQFPTVIDEGRRGHFSFLIITYMEGENLSEVLKERSLSMQEVYSFATQICEMFLYLHSRVPAIIYRDLKPDNLILSKDGKLVLVDFGAAREYKEGQREDTILLGTRGFAAPEQFGNMGQTDKRTDIYAIGRVLCIFLGGEDKLEDCRERELVRIIRKCIAKQREKRYDSVKEIWKALKKARERKKQRIKRVILILGLAIFFFSKLFWDRQREQSEQAICEQQMRELDKKIEQGWDTGKIIEYIEEGEDVKKRGDDKIYDRILRYAIERGVQEERRALAWLSRRLDIGEMKKENKKEEKGEDIFFFVGKSYTQLFLLGQDIDITEREIEQYLDYSDFTIAKQYKKLLQKSGICTGKEKDTKILLFEISTYLDRLPISRLCLEGRLSFMKFYEQIEDFSMIKTEWAVQAEKTKREIEYLEKKGKNLREEKKIFYENTLSYWMKMEENLGKEEESEYVKMQIACVEQLQYLTTYEEQLEWKKKELFLTRIMLENEWVTPTERQSKIKKLREEMEVLIELYPKDVELYSEYGLFLLHIEEDLKKAKFIYEEASMLRVEQSEKFFLLEEEIVERTQGKEKMEVS